MAVTTLSPYHPAPDNAEDPVSLTEASALFAECGREYEVPVRTLKRWCVKHGVRTERIGRDDYASWTDLLEIHREEIDRREARAGA